jgi:hypothetical protein
LSYGNKGIWPVTDYLGIDDATEIWVGPRRHRADEIQRDGTGMWAYVDGGSGTCPAVARLRRTCSPTRPSPSRRSRRGAFPLPSPAD